VATTDTAARNQIWSQIDRQVMSDAVILPGVYAKSLLYRNPERNVIVKHGLRAALTPIVTIFGPGPGPTREGITSPMDSDDQMKSPTIRTLGSRRPTVIAAGVDLCGPLVSFQGWRPKH